MPFSCGVCLRFFVHLCRKKECGFSLQSGETGLAIGYPESRDFLGQIVKTFLKNLIQYSALGSIHSPGFNFSQHKPLAHARCLSFLLCMVFSFFWLLPSKSSAVIFYSSSVQANSGNSNTTSIAIAIAAGDDVV